MYYHNPYMVHYENLVAKMLPSYYHNLIHHVKSICEREDHPYNPAMYPFPNEDKINELVEEIYNKYKNDNKKLSDNQHRGHCHDDFLCDILKLLIIRELLDRRRCRHCRRRHFYF